MAELQPAAERSVAVDFTITRSEERGDGFTLEGYAAVFGSPTEIDSWEGRFTEVIARGAFTKTIQERTPVMQFDHGHHPFIGSIPIAAIQTLREDARGLFVRARLHDNARVEPIRQAIASGAIDGMSFRFSVVRDDWTAPQGRRLAQRNIQEVKLYELGPVVFPAYAATTVGVRDVDTSEPAMDQSTDGVPAGDDAVTPDQEPREHSGPNLTIVRQRLLALHTER